MRQIPMLFNKDMVNALLRGRKTETRRILKPQPGAAHPIIAPSFIEGDKENPLGRWVWRIGHDGGIVDAHMGHRARPGDLIWVKETHFTYGYWKATGANTKSGKPKRKFQRLHTKGVLFDCPLGGPVSDKIDGQSGWHKRPSLFMERADSRLTLRVTGFNIVRLHDIDEAGAIAEGVEREILRGGQSFCEHITDPLMESGVSAYERLWNSINGPNAWDANPWVEVTKFEVIKRNVVKVASEL